MVAFAGKRSRFWVFSALITTHHQCTAALDKAELPFKVRLPQNQSFGPGANLALFVDPADLVLLTG